jgi:hypothetical protein
MKIIKSTVAIVIIGTGMAIAGCIALRNIRRDAIRSLITDLQKLQVGSTTKEETLTFVKAHGLRPLGSNVTSGDTYAYARVLDNWFLARAHLAPWTRLGILLKVEDDRLDYVNVDYYVACTGDLTSGVSVAEVPNSPNLPPYQISVSPASGKPPNIYIRMTPSSSPQERANALHLNTDCLTRTGGCSGASALLDTVGRPGLTCSTPTESARR